MKGETSNGRCKDVEKCIELLNVIMDNESIPEEEKFVNEQLENCACCLKQYEVEKEFRSLIKRKLEHKEVPSDLIAMIKHKIEMTH
ncbi:MAG: hypothetical protein AAGC88_08405 [Bacteroidota bacterium]